MIKYSTKCIKKGKVKLICLNVCLKRCQSIEIWDASDSFKIVRNTSNSDFGLTHRANSVVNNADFLTRMDTATRRAALTLASVKKAEKSRDLSCRRCCHLRIAFVSAKKRRWFSTATIPHCARRSRSVEAVRARSFNGIYIFCDFHLARCRSHFLQSSNRSLRRGDDYSRDKRQKMRKH
jgi:hypothetical protein